MRSRSLPPAIACGLSLAMLGGAPAHAQTPADPATIRAAAAPSAEPRGETRTLAGFALLPPIRFESPLPVTSIGLGLTVKIGGDDRGVPAARPPAPSQLLSVSQSFDFSARVHPRVALLASVGGVVAAGVSDETFYALGADGALRFRAGVTGVIARLDGGATQIAGHLVVDGLRSTRLGPPAKIVGRFVEKQALPLDDLLVSGRESESIRVSWSAAHVISRHLSAQGSVGITGSFARSKGIGERGSHGEILAMGAALGAELGPVAAQLEIDVNAALHRTPEIGVSPLSLLEVDAPFFACLGVYYAARRELVIGGGGGVEAAEGDRLRGVARLELRYVF